MRYSNDYYFFFCLVFTFFSSPFLFADDVFTKNAFKSTYESKVIHNNKIVVVDTVLFHFQTKPWNTQLRVQKLLEFYHRHDTLRLREVLLNQGTFDFTLKRQWKRKYLRKKNFSFLNNSSRTGYILNSNFFYFHPIRSGLYDKAFWAPHPFVKFKAFDSYKDTFYNNLFIPQLGTVEMKYIATKEIIFDHKKAEYRSVLKIIAKSKISDERYEKIKAKKWFDEDKNNVQLSMIFSIERGFESIEYLFPSGTRIEYYLISIEYD